MYIVMHVKDPDAQNINKLLLLALKSFLEQSGNSPLGTPYEQKLEYTDIQVWEAIPKNINRERVYDIWDELLRGFVDLYKDSNLYRSDQYGKLLLYAKTKDRDIRECLKLPEKPFITEEGATK